MRIQKPKQAHISSTAKFLDQNRQRHEADPAWEGELVLWWYFWPPLDDLVKGLIFAHPARHHLLQEVLPPPPRLTNLSSVLPCTNLYCRMYQQFIWIPESLEGMNALTCALLSLAQRVSCGKAHQLWNRWADLTRGWAPLETVLITFMSFSGRD